MKNLEKANLMKKIINEKNNKIKKLKIGEKFYIRTKENLIPKQAIFVGIYGIDNDILSFETNGYKINYKIIDICMGDVEIKNEKGEII